MKLLVLAGAEEKTGARLGAFKKGAMAGASEGGSVGAAVGHVGGGTKLEKTEQKV